MKKNKNVTIIGGGSGTYVVTQGLKDFDHYNLTKIVTVFDSGGSSARLRDEFGFLPVGDLRQSLASIAQENHQSWIRELLLYRFNKGHGLKGHNLGNLILTALQDMTGSTPEALKVATKIFRLKGKVLPIATKNVDLLITYNDGSQLIGEDFLDDPKYGGKKITKLNLTKPCNIHSPSKQAILDSDYIIIGPGDIYGSLVPNFLVHGFKGAIKSTKAKIIYIVNLMTRYTQTHNFKATDHIDIIEKYLGSPLDYVLVNHGPINPAIAKKYATYHEFPVLDDLPVDHHSKVIRGNFASSVEVKKQPGDKLARALMRHDRDKLLQALIRILK